MQGFGESSKQSKASCAQDSGQDCPCANPLDGNKKAQFWVMFGLQYLSIYLSIYLGVCVCVSQQMVPKGQPGRLCCFLNLLVVQRTGGADPQPGVDAADVVDMLTRQAANHLPHVQRLMTNGAAVVSFLQLLARQGGQHISLNPTPTHRHLFASNLGVDSLSLLFNHRSFQKPPVCPGFFIPRKKDPWKEGGRHPRSKHKHAALSWKISEANWPQIENPKRQTPKVRPRSDLSLRLQCRGSAAVSSLAQKRGGPFMYRCRQIVPRLQLLSRQVSDLMERLECF